MYVSTSQNPCPGEENPDIQPVLAMLKQGRTAQVLNGQSACPVGALRTRLRLAGLRPTRQRMILGWLLFARGHRHVSVEALYEESQRANASLSLATVYNTLRQFEEAHLLRLVPTGGGKTYFDTNVRQHHHYLVEDTDDMMDMTQDLAVSPPEAPPGYEVVGIDVVVRLRRIGSAS